MVFNGLVLVLVYLQHLDGMLHGVIVFMWQLVKELILLLGVLMEHNGLELVQQFLVQEDRMLVLEIIYFYQVELVLIHWLIHLMVLLGQQYLVILQYLHLDVQLR